MNDATRLMTLPMIALGFSGLAHADVTAFLGENTLIGPKTNLAEFEGIPDESSLMGYSEDGLSVSVDASAYNWNAPGLDGSGVFYANTGTRSLIDISLMSGEDFGAMDLQFSTGWDANNPTTVYLWVQVWNDGQMVQELDINGVSGQFLALAGDDFDLVRIGSYQSSSERDEHLESNKNAIVVDNISVGTLVPTPGAAGLLAVGGLAASRRRRA